MKHLFLFALLLLGAALLSTPSHAQIPEIPEAWAGVWDLDTIERECGIPVIIDQYSDLDTLCTGEILDVGDEGGFVPECLGTITDTRIDMVCGFSVEAFPGCDVTFSYTLDLTRDGDSVSGTGITEIIYEGICFVENECYEEEISGTRIAPEPEDCTNVAAPAASWGALKARF